MIRKYTYHKHDDKQQKYTAGAASPHRAFKKGHAQRREGVVGGQYETRSNHYFKIVNMYVDRGGGPRTKAAPWCDVEGEAAAKRPISPVHDALKVQHVFMGRHGHKLRLLQQLLPQRRPRARIRAPVQPQQRLCADSRDKLASIVIIRRGAYAGPSEDVARTVANARCS